MSAIALMRGKGTQGLGTFALVQNEQARKTYIARSDISLLTGQFSPGQFVLDGNTKLTMAGLGPVTQRRASARQ